jgi:hypothetical protein
VPELPPVAPPEPERPPEPLPPVELIPPFPFPPPDPSGRSFDELEHPARTATVSVVIAKNVV